LAILGVADLMLTHALAFGRPFGQMTGLTVPSASFVSLPQFAGFAPLAATITTAGTTEAGAITVDAAGVESFAFQLARIVWSPLNWMAAPGAKTEVELMGCQPVSVWPDLVQSAALGNEAQEVAAPLNVVVVQEPPFALSAMV
jgi:hypothetical protein